MTRKQALIKLRDKVEAGEWDHGIKGSARAVFPYEIKLADDLGWIASEAFSGSLDAAFALHQAVLPNEGWRVEWIAKYAALAFAEAPFCASVGWGETHTAYSETPARAWLLSILSALIAEAGDDA